MNRDNRSPERRSILHEDKCWRAWPESRSQQVVKTCKMSHYSKSGGFIVILKYWSYERFGMAFAQNWFFSCLSCNAMSDTRESSLLLLKPQWPLPLKGCLSFRLAVGIFYCLPLHSSSPDDCPEDGRKQSSWDAAWVPHLLPLFSQHLPASARGRLSIPSVAQEFSDGQVILAIEQKYLENHLFCTGLRFDLSASQVAAISLSIVPELLAPALFNKKLFKTKVIFYWDCCKSL